LLGPLRKLYWVNELLPAHSVLSFFKIWEKSG
jgi:hypothetical protein